VGGQPQLAALPSLAVTLLLASWSILYWQGLDPWLLGGLAAFFVVLGSWLVTRAEPQ
jgi:hypothetical protein